MRGPAVSARRPRRQRSACASGSAQSATTTLPLGGLSYTVRYSGDTNFTTVTSPCVSVAATQYAPTISLALSNTNVLAGQLGVCKLGSR